MKKKMVLIAADIGNTNIDVGLFEGETMLQRCKLSSVPVSSADWEDILSQLASTESKPAAAIICSVSPKVTPAFEKIIEKVFGVSPTILKSDTPLKLKNCYSNPTDVGPDRIANAYAVWQLYGVPALVVDFGTAITIDAISAEAEYLGGVIAPGVGLAAESLAEKTALLPRVTPQMPEKGLGRDTPSAIQSGRTYGNIGLIQYLVDRLKNELDFGDAAKIVITGGWSEIMQCPLKQISPLIDPDLTLKGLRIIYENELS